MGGPEPIRALGRQQGVLHSGNRTKGNLGNPAVLGHVSWVVKGSQFTDKLDQ